MKLSIVTVNYKSWGHLESALNALARSFPEDWEVIVVDNESDSTDFNSFAARYPWVTFVANTDNSGFGFGCNLGVAKASGELLLFMNPDVVATVADIQKLLQIKKQHHIGIVAPKQSSPSGKAQKVFDDFPSLLNQSKTLKALLRVIRPSRYRDPRANYTELTYCDWVTGSVLLIDREDFDAIGGWSEDYWMYVEDADLCRKATDCGLSVGYAPEVEVIHAHGGSSRLNVAVKSMTKLEVIISKHVYTRNHTRGLARWLTHTQIVLLRLPMLIVAALLDLISLRQIPTLNVRSRMLVGLLRYYAGVIEGGSWLSPRAIANQTSADQSPE